MKLQCPKCGERYEQEVMILARLADRQQFHFRLELEEDALLNVEAVTSTISGFAECLRQTARVLGGEVLVSILSMSFDDRVLEVTLLVAAIKKPVEAPVAEDNGPAPHGAPPFADVAASLERKGEFEQAQLDAFAAGANLSSVVNTPNGSPSELQLSFLCWFRLGAWRLKNGTLESDDRTKTIPDWPRELLAKGKTFAFESMKAGLEFERGTWETAEYM